MMPTNQNGWRLDRQVTMGNIIIVLGVLFSGMTVWFGNNADIATLKEKVQEMEPVVAAHSTWIASATTQLNTIYSAQVTGRQERIDFQNDVTKILNELNLKIGTIQGALGVRE